MEHSPTHFHFHCDNNVVVAKLDELMQQIREVKILVESISHKEVERLQDLAHRLNSIAPNEEKS